MSIRVVFAVAIGLAVRVNSSSTDVSQCSDMERMLSTFILSDEYYRLCQGFQVPEEDIAELERFLVHTAIEEEEIESVESTNLRASSGVDTAEIGVEMVGQMDVVSHRPVSQSEDAIEFAEMSIPIDDYIALASADQLRAIRDSIVPYWNQPSQETWIVDIAVPVHLSLFNVLVNVRKMSLCETVYCQTWVELLEQIHYQVTVGIFERKWENFAEFEQFLLPKIAELLTAVPRVSPDQLQPRAFLPLAVVVPIVYEVGCCCLGLCLRECLGWAHSRANPTTVAPTVDSDPQQAIIEHLKTVQMQSLAISAFKELNSLMIHFAEIDPSSDGELQMAVDAARIGFMAKLMQIALAVMSNSGGVVDSVALHNGCMRITEVLNSQASLASWQSTKEDLFRAIKDILEVLKPFI